MNIAVFSLSVAAMSMAAVAIFCIIYLIHLREQNRFLRDKIKYMDVDLRMNILREMSKPRREWFIDSFCNKNRNIWLIAEKIVNKEQ